MDTQPAVGVRLRPGMGVLLAVQWNAPLLLLFCQSWSTFHLTMVGNCYLWAFGCFLAGRSARCRAILFRPAPEGTPPRWMAAAIWMGLLGTANFGAWFFGPGR